MLGLILKRKIFEVNYYIVSDFLQNSAAGWGDRAGAVTSHEPKEAEQGNQNSSL